MCTLFSVKNLETSEPLSFHYIMNYFSFMYYVKFQYNMLKIVLILGHNVKSSRNMNNFESSAYPLRCLCNVPFFCAYAVQEVSVSLLWQLVVLLNELYYTITHRRKAFYPFSNLAEKISHHSVFSVISTGTIILQLNYRLTAPMRKKILTFYLNKK